MPARDIYHDNAKNALIKDYQVQLMVYDLQAEVVLKWIP